MLLIVAGIVGTIADIAVLIICWAGLPPDDEQGDEEDPLCSRCLDRSRKARPARRWRRRGLIGSSGTPFFLLLSPCMARVL